MTNNPPITVTRPDLLTIWDYEKNTIKPEDVQKGSRQVVSWRCPKCGQTWMNPVKHQSRLKKLCLHCGKGYVPHEERVGLQKHNKQNQLMTIVKYEAHTKVLVEFEDGSQKYTTYQCFQQGSVRHPTAFPQYQMLLERLVSGNPNAANLVGNSYRVNNGEIVKVIAYRAHKDIDIQFADGTIRQHVRVSNLALGSIAAVGQERDIPKLHQERLHVTKKMRNGLMATIIAYRNNEDIDVRFENDVIVTNKCYRDFEKGYIRLPHQTLSDVRLYTSKNKREGLQMQHKNGLLMTLVEYNNHRDVVVEFEDGERVRTTLAAFNNRYAVHPYKHHSLPSRPECTLFFYLQNFGFTKPAQGYYKKFHSDFGKMEFDAFNEQFRIAVEYDGIWHNSEHGRKNDKRKEKLGKQHGMHIIRIREAGLPMKGFMHAIVRNNLQDAEEFNTIIRDVLKYINEYTNQNIPIDVDITRDADKIDAIYKERYHDLNEHIGEKSIASCGQEMEIVDYINYGNITVRFADGNIRDHISYYHFKSGLVAPIRRSLSEIREEYMKQRSKQHAEERLGEVAKTNNGEEMTLIAYRSSQDVDVKFADGTIVHTTYATFKCGEILNPNTTLPRTARLRKQMEERLGSVHTTNAGYKITIIEYNGAEDVTIKFEDGEIMQHIRYQDVVHGFIRKPSDKLSRSASERLGQVFQNTKGDNMTIITYNGSNDVTVAFDDGTIREHVTYTNIKRGSILKPRKSA